MGTAERVHKPVIDAELIAAIERIGRGDDTRPEGAFTSAEFMKASGFGRCKTYQLLKMGVESGQLRAEQGTKKNVVGTRSLTVWYTRAV